MPILETLESGSPQFIFYPDELFFLYDDYEIFVTNIFEILEEIVPQRVKSIDISRQPLLMLGVTEEEKEMLLDAFKADGVQIIRSNSRQKH